MKKNIILCLTTACVLISTCVPTFANTVKNDTAIQDTIVGTPQISVNGENIDLSKYNLSQYIFESNDNIMVPLRAVAEKMGYRVSWDNINKQFVAEDDNWKVVASIDDDNYYGVSKTAIGMTAPTNLGSAPIIIDGSTYVPAKMFEFMGYSYESIGEFVKFYNLTTIDDNDLDSDFTQIPNPFVSYDNIESAKKAMSFTPITPQYIPDGYDICDIAVMDSNFLQIMYQDKDNNQITYRMSEGDDDISGDYNTYSNSKNIVVNNQNISLKGNDKVANAIWTQDKYSFAIYCDKELSEDEITKIVENLK